MQRRQRAHEASALILDGGQLSVAEVHARRTAAEAFASTIYAGGCYATHYSDIDGTPPPSYCLTPYVGASKSDALRSVASHFRGVRERRGLKPECSAPSSDMAATAAMASGASTSNTDWSAADA